MEINHKIKIFSILLFSFASHIHTMELKLHNKPSNLSVYQWCVQRAHEQVSQQQEKLLSILGASKPYFLMQKKRLKKTIIENNYNTLNSLQRNAIHIPQKIKQAIIAVSENQAVKNMLGIKGVKQQTIGALTINAKYNTLIRVLNQLTALPGDLCFMPYARHILIDYTRVKEWDPAFIKHHVMQSLARIYCDHCIDKTIIENIKKMQQNAHPINLQLYQQEENRLNLLLQLEADVVSLFNDISEGEKVLKMFKKNYIKQTKPNYYLSQKCSLMKEIVSAMKQEQKIMQSHHTEPQIRNCFFQAESAYRNGAYEEAIKKYKALTDNAEKMNDHCACSYYIKALMRLGAIYGLGEGGIQKNIEQSVYFFEKLAGQTFYLAEKHQAKLTLGLLYLYHPESFNKLQSRGVAYLKSVANQTCDKKLQSKAAWNLGKYLIEQADQTQIEQGLCLLQKVGGQNECIESKIQALSILITQNKNIQAQRAAIAIAFRLGTYLLNAGKKEGITLLQRIAYQNRILDDTKCTSLTLLINQNLCKDTKHKALEMSFRTGEMAVQKGNTIGIMFLQLAANQNFCLDTKSKAINVIKELYENQKRQSNNSKKRSLSPLMQTTQQPEGHMAFHPTYNRLVPITCNKERSSTPVRKPKQKISPIQQSAAYTQPAQHKGNQQRAIPNQATPTPYVNLNQNNIFMPQVFLSPVQIVVPAFYVAPNNTNHEQASYF